MTTQVRKTTADELLSVPRDGYRYELVEGELRRVPPVGSEHGLLALAFASELRNYVGSGPRSTDSGSFTVIANEKSVQTDEVHGVGFGKRQRLADEAG